VILLALFAGWRLLFPSLLPLTSARQEHLVALRALPSCHPCTAPASQRTPGGNITFSWNNTK
jgi:hypothetical protein